MKHVNLDVDLTSTEEFASAESWEVGVWFRLVSYCCKRENSGAIHGCSSWSARTWLIAAGIDLEDLKRESKLWTWATVQPGVLWVHAYPQHTEEWVKAQRKRGRNGGSMKSDRKAEANRENASVVTDARSEAAKENGKKGGRPRKYVLEKPSQPNVMKGKVIPVEFDDGLLPDPGQREFR